MPESASLGVENMGAPAVESCLVEDTPGGRAEPMAKLAFTDASGGLWYIREYRLLTCRGQHSSQCLSISQLKIYTSWGPS